jgi:hypothetical protein
VAVLGRKSAKACFAVLKSATNAGIGAAGAGGNAVLGSADTG